MPVTLTPATLSAPLPNWMLLENVARKSAVATAPTPAAHSGSVCRSTQVGVAAGFGAGALAAAFFFAGAAARERFDLVAGTANEASCPPVERTQREGGAPRAPPSAPHVAACEAA